MLRTKTGKEPQQKRLNQIDFLKDIFHAHSVEKYELRYLRPAHSGQKNPIDNKRKEKNEQRKKEIQADNGKGRISRTANEGQQSSKGKEKKKEEKERKEGKEKSILERLRPYNAEKPDRTTDTAQTASKCGEK